MLPDPNTNFDYEVWQYIEFMPRQSEHSKWSRSVDASVARSLSGQAELQPAIKMPRWSRPRWQRVNHCARRYGHWTTAVNNEWWSTRLVRCENGRGRRRANQSCHIGGSKSFRMLNQKRKFCFWNNFVCMRFEDRENETNELRVNFEPLFCYIQTGHRVLWHVDLELPLRLHWPVHGEK